jgi:hypothetical protein|tara:strand:- start:915 stop:1283 length:369 start_codon:yes stop_codon:yes gene_type:complete
MTKNLLSIISIFSFIVISHTSLADKTYDKNNLLTCSAYHFKEKLNSQYSGEKKYNYHNNYFNNLKEIFMTQYPEVSTSSYILSITSIMESWSYEAQEKGQRYSDLKVQREYKDLCNSIIEIN